MGQVLHRGRSSSGLPHKGTHICGGSDDHQQAKEPAGATQPMVIDGRSSLPEGGSPYRRSQRSAECGHSATGPSVDDRTAPKDARRRRTIRTPTRSRYADLPRSLSLYYKRCVSEDAVRYRCRSISFVKAIATAPSPLARPRRGVVPRRPPGVEVIVDDQHADGYRPDVYFRYDPSGSDPSRRSAIDRRKQAARRGFCRRRGRGKPQPRQPRWACWLHCSCWPADGPPAPELRQKDAAAPERR